MAITKKINYKPHSYQESPKSVVNYKSDNLRYLRLLRGLETAVFMSIYRPKKKIPKETRNK